MVLGSRTIDTKVEMGANALIYEDRTSAFISADGNIAGIQMTVKTDQLFINEDIPLTVKSNYINDEYIILIYGASGETLSGDNIHLFSSSEGYEITTIIVVNELSESMNIDRSAALLPDEFELSQNFPNPFNPNTQIQFTIGQNELVSLNIFDVQGRLVNSLISNIYYTAGYHSMSWDGKNNLGTQVPSGMYLYKLVSENQTLTRKMVLMK